MGKNCTMAMFADEQQFQVRNAKVLVQFNQIWTIYRSGGFVRIDLV